MPEEPSRRTVTALRGWLKSYAVSKGARAELFAALGRDQLPAEALALLAEAARGVDPDLLGYGVFPAVRGWLDTDEGFEAALRALADPGLDAGFGAVLADFVDAGARRTDRWGRWADALRGFARDPGAAANLRLTAVRRLARDDADATRELLGELMSLPVPALAAEAAHSLTVLARAGCADPPRLDALAERIGAEAPVSLLRAAALDRSDASVGLVLRAGSAAGTAQARARVVGAAGDLLDPTSLAGMLAAAATTEEVTALRGLLAADMRRLFELPEHAFLSAAGMVAEAADEDVERRLLALATGADPDVAAAANLLINPARLPADRRLLRLGDGEAIPLESLEQRLGPGGSAWPNGPEPGSSKPTPAPTGRPYSTGFHIADACYRDLILPGTHLHTGVYLGFLPDVPAIGSGTMYGVHAANGIGWSDTITFFVASSVLFAKPSADLATVMRLLRNELVVQFQEGHYDAAFHGTRCPPSLTPDQRHAIAATASALYAKNIWWTWVDMLDYKWWDWDGTVDDIDESRCDGVVEYAYEHNGVRVCGGTDPARWNISLAGVENPENHNNFHNGAYQPGELCPRIQAGDLTHAAPADTTFVPDVPAPPTVADFAVYPYALIFVPSVWFRVLTPAYRTCFVRITVAKDGGAWHFARTEDPYNGSAPPALVADWRFVRVLANTADKLFGWWIGKTDDGTNFFGQNGTYAFRLVAVDPAGNVSELATTSVRIEWPRQG